MINIQIDSRLVKPGDTFVAIKGNIVDGHKFIDTAIKNGATKVIVSNNKNYSVETINVPDTEKYLQDYLVKNYAKEFDNMKIVGITGTNGKTTTAYMTYQLLRKLDKKVAYIGTIGFYYNDHFEHTLNTTPDILNLYKYLLKAKKEKCEIVLIEASSIGLMEGRMSGLKFDVAAYTNLTHDHLDYHKTMSEYKNAKLILFENLKENGTSVINADDKYGKYFMVNKNIITYGFKDTDILCTKHDNACKEFSYSFKGKEYETTSPLFGKYNIYNIMCSIGILASLNIDLNLINKYYPTLKAPTGRINMFDYKTNKIIIDYAHTPDGVKQVLSSACNLSAGKTYVVFGCPGNRDRAKRPMMGRIVSKYADYFIITDDDPHYEDEKKIADEIVKGVQDNSNYEVIIDRKKAIDKAFNMLKENDLLLILGKGHEEAIIVKDQRIPHNDLKYVDNLIKNAK